MKSLRHVGYVFCWVLIALLLLSCVTAPSALLNTETVTDSGARDSLRYFSPDALVYAKLRGPALRRFGPLFLTSLRDKSQALARADSVSLALYASAATGAAAEGTQSSPDAGPFPYRFEALIGGSYPAFWTKLSLAFSNGIKSQGSFFIDNSTGIQIAVPASGIIAAANPEIGPLAQRLDSAKRSPVLSNELQSPLPARLLALEDSGLFFCLPEPAKRAAALTGGEMPELPVSALLFAASPSPDDSEVYQMTLVLVTGDQNQARIFRPVARIVWLAISRWLFPDAGSEVSLPDFRQNGPDITSAQIPIKAGLLEEALKQLAGGAPLRTPPRP